MLDRTTGKPRGTPVVRRLQVTTAPIAAKSPAEHPAMTNWLRVTLRDFSASDPVVSKNTNELKTRVSRGVSDRRVYAWFAKGS